MEWQIGLGVGVLVYLAFVFDLFGFLARDELWLRLLMLAASGLYLGYFYLVAETPLWDAIITDAVLAVANLTMIGVVLAERTTFAMSADNAALSRLFPMLSPGQFRKLHRAASDLRAAAPVTLTTEGVVPHRLVFVAEGHVTLLKAGSSTRLAAPLFIGELAFLTGRPATATVQVAPGARYLAWPTEDLKRLLVRAEALNLALQAEFNRDLVAKVARSVPPDAV